MLSTTLRAISVSSVRAVAGPNFEAAEAVTMQKAGPMTLGTSHVDFEEALGDPQGWFAEPQDVVAHPELTPEQKLAILRRWEQDALRLSVSEAEGMVGGEENMLGRVERALQAVATLRQGG